MLHVAPESCFISRFKQAIGNGYLTADLFSKAVDVKMDICDIHYPDNTFDIIYCSHVLEHVPDDRKAMSEFQRVLKPDGWAVLLVPITAKQTVEDPSITDPHERSRVFGQEDHVRCYGPDYIERLRAAGFNVDCIKPVDFVSVNEIEHMGITEAAGELYYCHKLSALDQRV
jgi:SAM-dependent methyltransferase